MNLLTKLSNLGKGVAAQVNPFDHGATYSSVQQPVPLQPATPQPLQYQGVPSYNQAGASPQLQGAGTPAYHPVAPSLIQPQLMVQPNYGMQPNLTPQEDDYTQTQQLQPVDYNNQQVTAKGMFLQPGVPQQQPQYQGNRDALYRLLGF